MSCVDIDLISFCVNSNATHRSRVLVTVKFSCPKSRSFRAFSWDAIENTILYQIMFSFSANSHASAKFYIALK